MKRDKAVEEHEVIVTFKQSLGSPANEEWIDHK
jgi:hypothetical protein